MPRRRRTGAIYPVKDVQTKTLKDGTVRKYTRYRAKVADKWVSAKTYKECNEKIAEALREQASWGVTSKSTKLGDYLDSWIESKSHVVDPGTMQNYKAVCKHLAPYRNTRMSDITPSAAARMVSRMRSLTDGGMLAVGTKQRIVSDMSQIFKSAVADRIIPTNPMEGVPMPRRNETLIVSKRPGREQNRTAFSVGEMKRMLEASSHDLFTGTREWWRLLTGMRQTEVLGVVLDDLELHEVRLANGETGWQGYYVCNWKLEAMDRVHGCGERGSDGVYPCGYRRPSKCPDFAWVEPDVFDKIPLEGRFCLTPPKSKRGKVIPIIPALGTVVHRYLEATRDVPNPYGLLFRTREGRPIGAMDDRRDFRAMLKAAGIDNPEGRYVHECRNSVVSLLFSMHVDPGIIQRIVGHSSLAMSEHYRSVPVEELMSGMETIGDGLGLAQIGWEVEE